MALTGPCTTKGSTNVQILSPDPMTKPPDPREQDVAPSSAAVPIEVVLRNNLKLDDLTLALYKATRDSSAGDPVDFKELPIARQVRLRELATMAFLEVTQPEIYQIATWRGATALAIAHQETTRGRAVVGRIGGVIGKLEDLGAIDRAAYRHWSIAFLSAYRTCLKGIMPVAPSERRKAKGFWEGE